MISSNRVFFFKKKKKEATLVTLKTPCDRSTKPSIFVTEFKKYCFKTHGDRDLPVTHHLLTR